MELLRILIASTILFLGSVSAFSQKMDGTVTFVNPIPLPLGRYVQLVDSVVLYSVDYYTAGYDRYDVKFLFDFRIVRHISNLEYMNIDAQSVEPHIFYVDYKHDLTAMEELSRSIENPQVANVPVPWTESYGKVFAGDIKSLKSRIRGQKMKFTDSKIFRHIPQSNVEFKGCNSEYLYATSPVVIMISAEDGYTYFHVKVHYMSKSSDKSEKPSYVVVRSADGDFEATLSASPTQIANHWRFDKYRLSPKLMDKLLSSPLQITVTAVKR